MLAGAALSSALAWGAPVARAAWPAPAGRRDDGGIALLEARAARGELDQVAAEALRGCDQARDPDLESRLALLAGTLLARLGRYPLAVESLRRHLRTGRAIDGQGQLWLGTALLALGEGAAALGPLRAAVELAELGVLAAPAALSRALYGLALAHELAGREPAVREALLRAGAHDRAGVARAACAGVLEPPALEPAHAAFLCALVTAERPEELAQAGQPSPAPAWERLAEDPGVGQAWRARAALRAARTQPPAAAGRAGLRVVAIAAVSSDGPLPTPIVDVALQAGLRARGGLRRCVEPEADRARPGQRWRVRLVISGGGRLDAVVALADAAEDAAATPAFAACLAREWTSLLSLPRDPAGRPTVVEVELVLGR